MKTKAIGKHEGALKVKVTKAKTGEVIEVDGDVIQEEYLDPYYVITKCINVDGVSTPLTRMIIENADVGSAFSYNLLTQLKEAE